MVMRFEGLCAIYIIRSVGYVIRSVGYIIRSVAYIIRSVGKKSEWFSWSDFQQLQQVHFGKIADGALGLVCFH